MRGPASTSTIIPLSRSKELGEPFTGALGELHSAAIPCANEMSHRFGGRFDESIALRLVEAFQSFSHDVGLGPTGLARETLDEERGFRVYPHVENAHNSSIVCRCAVTSISIRMRGSTRPQTIAVAAGRTSRNTSPQTIPMDGQSFGSGT